MRLLNLIACGYLAIAVVVITGAVVMLGGTPRLETNIFALLPSIHRDPELEAVAKNQANLMSAKMLVFVRGGHEREVERVALDVAQRMRASELFASVEATVSTERLTALRELFSRVPFQLTDPPGGDGDALATLLAGARERAFSPEGIQWLQGVASDPLLLFPDYLASAFSGQARVVARNGFLRVDEPGARVVMVVATVGPRGLNQHRGRPVSRFFDSLPSYAGTTVMPTGVTLFAEESAGRMEREVSLLSTITLIALAALFVWVFRSGWIALLLMTSVVSSCAGAVILTALVWERWSGTSMHLLTVGFGSALLGVSSDYAAHYLIAHRTARDESRIGPLRRVMSGLLLGFLTSVVGFLGIALSPFPGLQQLALFSYVGLLLSLLTVVAMFPAVAGRPRRDERLALLAGSSKALVSRRARVVIVMLLCLPIAYGAWELRVLDDIRALDKPSMELVGNQREAARMLGMSEGGTAIVVRGANEEEVLQREELVTRQLDRLVASGELDGYRALSQLVPSKQRQSERFARYSRLLGSSDAEVAQFVSELRLPQVSVETLQSIRQGSPIQYLTIAECLASSACDSARDFVSSLAPGRVATVIPISGARGGVTALASELSSDGVTVVNQADAISTALTLYRQAAIRSTAMFYGVIFVILALRYGWSGAWRAFVPPLGGGLAALGSLGLMGIPLNVFSVFALMVLLGVSVDYAIFLAEESTEEEGAGLSVTLSAAATAISFGPLAFSSSPALQGFGIVLSAGAVMAALLAPLARQRGAKR